MTQLQKPGRQPYDAADIEARRNDFQRLRRHLKMTAAQIGKMTGLKTGTVRNYCSPRKPNVAATWEAIVLMREEATYRKIAEIKQLEESLFRAEVELQQITQTGIPPRFRDRYQPSLETAVPVTDRCRDAAQGGPGYPHHSPLQSAPDTPVSGQV